MAKAQPKDTQPTDIRSAGWSADDWRRVQSTVDGVDALAVEMERRWGVGRLRLIVDDELRGKFDRQALVRYIGASSSTRRRSRASPKPVARRNSSVVGQANSEREK